MNKKVAIFAIIIILAVTLVVYLAYWQRVDRESVGNKANNGSSAAKKSTVQKQPASNVENGSAPAENDSDIQSIENEMNTISDNDFNTEALSEENIGL